MTSSMLPPFRKSRLAKGLAVLALAFLALSIKSNHVHGEDDGGAKEAQPIYITDMRQCSPATKLANKSERSKWRNIPYETAEHKGHLIGAASFINAGEIRLPINLKGTFSVYLGIWNPYFMYDGKPIVKVRLSSNPIFQQIHPGASPDTQNDTYIEEVHAFDADVTNNDLMFAKSNGLQPHSAYIAYVKLVPISQEQINERQNNRKRNLVATIDGISIFHFYECSTMNHFREILEPYKQSSVKKVLWAVTYGDRTSYPTQLPQLTYLGDKHQSSGSKAPFGNDYQRGAKQMHDFLSQCERQGIVPQQQLAKDAHAQGLKFDLMYRLGILGGLGVAQFHQDGFLNQHPEFRQVTHEGVALEKASFAFPQVQQLVLDQINESLHKIDADGVNLCFTRGPHFLQSEQPILDEFKKRHGIDANSVPADDERLKVIRAEIMTGFIQKVRSLLDNISRKTSHKRTLSVWVWHSEQNVWLGRRPWDEGLDVKTWIQKGLLDSVICKGGVDQEYIKLGKKHNCEFVFHAIHRGDRSTSASSIQRGFDEGASSFAFWDIDAFQHHPPTWHWLKETGNRKKIAELATPDKDKAATVKPHRPLFRLLKLNNRDVDKGLTDAVYSGG